MMLLMVRRGGSRFGRLSGRVQLLAFNPFADGALPPCHPVGSEADRSRKAPGTNCPINGGTRQRRKRAEFREPYKPIKGFDHVHLQCRPMRRWSIDATVILPAPPNLKLQSVG